MKIKRQKEIYTAISLALLIFVIYFIQQDYSNNFPHIPINALSVKESDYISKDLSLYTSTGEVFYLGDCGDTNPNADMGIKTKNLIIYNDNFFGDGKSVWGEFFSGASCGTPVKISVVPPLDIATLKVLPEKTDLLEDKHGLISLGSDPENQNTAQRIGPLDATINYLRDNFITVNGSLYYYYWSYGDLMPLPGILKNQDQIKSFYSSPNVDYIVSSEKVFAFYPWNYSYKGTTTLIEELAGADAATFHPLETEDYYGDKYGVYLIEKKLPDASSTDFISLQEGYYSSNGYTYFKDTKLATQRYSPFFEIPGQLSYSDGWCGSYKYWTDGNNVYYEGNSLDTTPQNFKFENFPAFKCTQTGYAWNGNKFFYQGSEVIGVDTDSFKIIKNVFARDAYHVYEEGKILPGDPNSLESDINSGKIQHIYPNYAE